MRPAIAAFLMTALATVSPALAAGDLSRTDVIEVKLEMGSKDGGMYFKPGTFEFETGRAYKLVMTNADEIKHELALNEMGEKIYTRKIEAKDAAGNLITEVKGSIREVEVGPGQTVEWYFVPIQPMESSDITCEIPGHLEAGMRAAVTIK